MRKISSTIGLAALVAGQAFLATAAPLPASVAGEYPLSAGPVPADAVPVSTSPAVNQVLLGSGVRSWNGAVPAAQYFTIFDLDAPGVLPNVAAFPSPAFIGAGEFVNGLSYMVNDANTVYVVDDSGTIVDEYTATVPPGGQAWSGMALDPTTGDVYASSTNVTAGESTLFTFDVLTGTATQVGPIPAGPGTIALSFDGVGNLFGYDIVDDVFFQIDPATGATSNVTPLPFNANFGQGMMYDPMTGLLNMLAVAVGPNRAELWTVDTSNPATPVFTFVGNLGSTIPGGINQLSWGGTEIDVDLPVIEVDPASVSSTQGEDTTTQHTLTISNIGDADLVWTIDEAEPASGYPGLRGGVTSFDGDFAIDNWTLVNTPVDVDGSFTTDAGPPISVTVIGGNASIGGDTDFQITILEDGEISFDWSYTSEDDPGFDSGGYAVNGVYTMLASASGNSGSQSVTVVAGDVFSFRVWTDDGSFGAGEFTVTNFAFQLAVGCAAPSDVPWLSVSPDAGTTAPSDSTDVTVSLDSTGLAEGSYEALLCVSSNDPFNRLVVVPVDLTVKGEIDCIFADGFEEGGDGTCPPL